MSFSSSAVFLLYIILQRKEHASALRGCSCRVHDQVSANNMSDCIDSRKCQPLTSPDDNTLQHATWLRGSRTIRWSEPAEPNESSWRREDRKTSRHGSKGNGYREEGKEKRWKAEWEVSVLSESKHAAGFYLCKSRIYNIGGCWLRFHWRERKCVEKEHTVKTCFQLLLFQSFLFFQMLLTVVMLFTILITEEDNFQFVVYISMRQMSVNINRRGAEPRRKKNEAVMPKRSSFSSI